SSHRLVDTRLALGGNLASIGGHCAARPLDDFRNEFNWCGWCTGWAQCGRILHVCPPEIEMPCPILCRARRVVNSWTLHRLSNDRLPPAEHGGNVLYEAQGTPHTGADRTCVTKATVRNEARHSTKR